jgi:4-hydroxy-2-oxoheptanedioate aldolase
VTTRNRLKAKIAAGEDATGLSCMIGDAQIAEEFAMAGYDYIYIDQQHGLVSHERLVQMLRSISRSETTPLVRVAGNDGALIAQALDAGAEGVIIPMVEDAEAAEKAARATRYFPDGQRSWGPIRAMHGLGADPVVVNAEVMCLVMIETAKGVENADAILSTPGIDGVYIGPADLAVSLGSPPRSVEQTTDQAPLDAIREIREACARNGKVVAITGVPETRHAEGFGMVTASSDINMIRSSLAALRSTNK